MFLEAYIDENSVRELILKTTPLRLHFGGSKENRRWMDLDEPSEIRMEKDRGLVIKSSARIRFAWGAIEPLISIREITLLLRPVISEIEAGGQSLDFAIDILDADLVNVPSIIDAGIVGAVNAAITARSTKLRWGFTEKLTSHFSLPPSCDPAQALCLEATGGSVQVDDDAIRFRVAFRIGVDTNVDSAQKGRLVPPSTASSDDVPLPA